MLSFFDMDKILSSGKGLSGGKETVIRDALLDN